MRADERNDFIYNSAKLLVDPEGTGKYDSLSEQEYKAEIDIYWNANDPLFLTKYNERLLEHYSRVAYANLRFGFNDIPGWKTDRGEVYVRYGEPLNKTRFRPQFGGSGRAESNTRSNLKSGI